MSRNNILSIIIPTTLMLVIGIALGFWFDSGNVVVKVEKSVEYKTNEVVKEVEVSRRDESTRACVKNGGVPTYSAWDGNLNGCIFVGQSHRDTNVEVKK